MGNSGHAPPYVKVDVPALNTMARNYATQGYAWSDADWKKRFPEFAKGRDFTIANAGTNLGGNVDPLVTSGLKTSGLGMVDLSGTNQYDKARNMGVQNIATAPERDRRYFERLFNDPLNQPRGDLAGLSGKNIAEIRAVESGNKINYDWANFGTRINQANAQTAAANALGARFGSVAGNIAGTAANSFLNQPSQQSPYVTGNAYGNFGVQSGSGFTPYYNPPNLQYTGPGGYEGQMNGQPVYAASPVAGQDYSGGSSSGGGP